MTDLGLPEFFSLHEEESFRSLTRRLSKLSVERASNWFGDIDWDAPVNRIEAGDPRWEALGAWDPLAQSSWYRDQSPEDRAHIGLQRQVHGLKTVIAFEAALCHGLLGFAARLPNDHPAFRYAYHEMAEEAQHTLMFQEFIDRSGFDPPRPPADLDVLVGRLGDMNDADVVLLFVAILAGEDAFDHVQRLTLAEPDVHPLLAQISRIHVSEEARHISFARELLRSLVPRLDSRQVRILRMEVPVLLGRMAAFMFGSTLASLTPWDPPSELVAELSDGACARGLRRKSLERLVALCGELGLIDPRLGSLWAPLTAA